MGLLTVLGRLCVMHIPDSSLSATPADLFFSQHNGAIPFQHIKMFYHFSYCDLDHSPFLKNANV